MAAALLLATLLLGPAAAHAQSSGGALDVQRFDTRAQIRSFALVYDADTAKRGAVAGIATLSYGWRPLEISSVGGSPSIGLIDHIVGLDLGVAYAPLDWLQLGLMLPVLQGVVYSDEGAKLLGQFQGAQTVGIGDLALDVGFAPVRQEAGMPLNFAVVPRFTFPTGTRSASLTSGTVGIALEAALSRSWSFLGIAGTLGYRFQPVSEATLGLYPDDELTYGLAATVPVHRDWAVDLEWSGAAVLVPDGGAAVGPTYDSLAHTPMELLAAARWAPEGKPVWLRFGVGPGLTRGFGTPAVRAFVTVGAGRLDPVRDRDGDGINDPDDACVDDPEDLDQFEDEDGCPDLDDDGDGIPDADDACKMNPEDADGFQDDDGCPEIDNDGDGVLDMEDGELDDSGFGSCRDKPEDVDGFADEDGCPELDNDMDGIPDLRDGVIDASGFGDCRNLPEVVNGVDDEDGCPDEALAELDVVKQEIRIKDQVYFDLGKSTVKKASYPVLDAVVAVLRTYPQIKLVEIGGHTDARGSEKTNLRLSQGRVDSVRAYLISQGIEDVRLTSVGYGESRLVIADAKTEDDHAQNRRVEFRVLEQDPIWVEVPADEAPAE
ncbi:MAG: OmpA family protein [Alphaproteobacteria bacterium]|nr:OmpA family protein [Alphaproteobacteria bacterium]